MTEPHYLFAFALSTLYYYCYLFSYSIENNAHIMMRSWCWISTILFLFNKFGPKGRFALVTSVSWSVVPTRLCHLLVKGTLLTCHNRRIREHFSCNVKELSDFCFFIKGIKWGRLTRAASSIARNALLWEKVLTYVIWETLSQNALLFKERS